MKYGLNTLVDFVVVGVVVVVVVVEVVVVVVAVLVLVCLLPMSKFNQSVLNSS